MKATIVIASLIAINTALVSAQVSVHNARRTGFDSTGAPATAQPVATVSPYRIARFVIEEQATGQLFVGERQVLVVDAVAQAVAVDAGIALELSHAVIAADLARNVEFLIAAPGTSEPVLGVEPVHSLVAGHAAVAAAR